jgi:hypothetical protein
MKTEIRIISKELANQMLKRNGKNRSLNQKHVKFLSEEMINGNWLFDGQPIRFSDDGRLLDGQHRLNAVVDSDTSQEFLIVTGVKSEAFKVMDTGRSRSASDCFFINGVSYANDVSACSKFILSFNKGVNYSKLNKISNTDLLEFYEENKDILNFVKESVGLSKAFSSVMSRSNIASFLYLFSKKDVLMAETFFHKLCYGLDIDRRSPIYVLRKKLTEDKMAKARLSPQDKNALIIKAWNLFRLNKDCSFIRWSKKDEKFPAII